MPVTRAPAVEPRKIPVQARALATLEAIREATVQLLVANGPRGVSMALVARRAGVSVGTIYQYFPQRTALIYAVNEAYLDALAARIEAVCLMHRGADVATMVGALVETYWTAKTERPEVTRALYRSVADIDNDAMIDAFARRVDGASAAMLSTARDGSFDDLRTVTLALLATIFGTVRNVFERHLAPAEAIAVRDQLGLMCDGYLKAASRRRVEA